jgi:hypothetical protein
MESILIQAQILKTKIVSFGRYFRKTSMFMLIEVVERSEVFKKDRRYGKNQKIR